MNINNQALQNLYNQSFLRYLIQRLREPDAGLESE